jgi:predicted Zn-dependent protease
MKLRALLLSFGLLVGGSPAGAQNLPDLGESAQSDLSPQAERRLGESIVRDIRLREPSYVDDPEIQHYLQTLGDRLVASSPEGQPDFVFFAIRDPTINAFALPGGFIGTHTGLITAAQSESELAGVLSHEIAHVTQRHIARMLGVQNQSNMAAMASLVVAILAASSSPQLAQAAIAAGQAAAIQSQLNYSRDFEREADRIGLQVLDRAGLDPEGMVSFFERLQKSSPTPEDGALSYLRTHPLTTERIADMANRTQSMPLRPGADSLSFHLVRARIQAQEGSARDTAALLASRLKEGRFASEAAARYGLAYALARGRELAAASEQIGKLRESRVEHPMVDTLAAEIHLKGGDPAAAVAVLTESLRRHPNFRPLTYALVEAQLAAGNPRAALDIVAPAVQLTPSDYRLWSLQAKTYAALGKRLQQHRSQAELYALNGQYPAAVMQLEIAQKAGDGDFYELSAVDARLREMRALHAEELKQRRK